MTKIPVNGQSQVQPETTKAGNKSIGDENNREVLPLSEIEPDASQIRKEFSDKEIQMLANSIKENGLVTPIIVSRRNSETGKHKIIDGERRYRAYLLLSNDGNNGDTYKKIPINYFVADSSISGILANMARKVYNPMESAEALQHIKKVTQFTDEQIGHLVERSRSSVTEYLSLLNLPSEIRESAKKDSCVPFRELKRLASRGDTDEAKIEVYRNLQKRYRPKEFGHKRKGSRKYEWSADRIAGEFPKKIGTMIEKMGMLKIDQMKDADKKAELKKALSRLTEKIEELNKALES